MTTTEGVNPLNQLRTIAQVAERAGLHKLEPVASDPIVAREQRGAHWIDFHCPICLGYGNQHNCHVAYHPDQVRIWAASADVSVIAVPANSLNQRLSTPNKFWESLAAGTPVVLGRDLEVMRAMVEADRLGAIADPEDPEDLARALREILEQPRGDYEAMRARLHGPGAETLAYDVPDGQDAAALIVALGRAGYPAVEDVGGGVHQVLVSCPNGPEKARPQVRTILEDAGISRHTIRFVDER